MDPPATEPSGKAQAGEACCGRAEGPGRTSPGTSQRKEHCRNGSSRSEAQPSGASESHLLFICFSSVIRRCEKARNRYISTIPGICDNKLFCYLSVIRRYPGIYGCYRSSFMASVNPALYITFIYAQRFSFLSQALPTEDLYTPSPYT